MEKLFHGHFFWVPPFFKWADIIISRTKFCRYTGFFSRALSPHEFAFLAYCHKQFKSKKQFSKLLIRLFHGDFSCFTGTLFEFFSRTPISVSRVEFDESPLGPRVRFFFSRPLFWQKPRFFFRRAFFHGEKYCVL